MKDIYPDERNCNDIKSEFNCCVKCVPTLANDKLKKPRRAGALNTKYTVFYFIFY